MSTKQPNKDADLSIVNRITDLLIAKHISAKELANAIGIHASAISEWKNGKTESYKKSLPQIAEFFHLPISYFYGEELPQNEKAVPDNLIPISGNEIYMFPVIGTISAGYDGIAEYNPSGEEISIPQHLLKSHNPDDYFVLEVRGNSMYPLYLDGDKVLIRKCTSVDSGKIAAIGYDSEEATLKKVEYVKGENWMKLIPRNPEYPTKTIRGGDLELCRVYGEVVYLFRDNVSF